MSDRANPVVIGNATLYLGGCLEIKIACERIENADRQQRMFS